MSSTCIWGHLRSVFNSLVNWFDSDYRAREKAALQESGDRVEWIRSIPFVILHLGCLGVIWTGWSWPAVTIAVLLYFVRMFAITGFYHRYFSHRTFSTSRFWQFVIA